MTDNASKAEQRKVQLKYLQALNRIGDHQTSQASKRGSGFAAYLFNREDESKDGTQPPYLSEEKYMYTISNLVSIEKCKFDEC